jgi:hypothetical protein
VNLIELYIVEVHSVRECEVEGVRWVEIDATTNGYGNVTRGKHTCVCGEPGDEIARGTRWMHPSCLRVLLSVVVRLEVAAIAAIPGGHGSPERVARAVADGRERLARIRRPGSDAWWAA